MVVETTETAVVVFEPPLPFTTAFPPEPPFPFAVVFDAAVEVVVSAFPFPALVVVSVFPFPALVVVSVFPFPALVVVLAESCETFTYR